MTEDLAERAFIAYIGCVNFLLVAAVLLAVLGKKRGLKIAGAAGILLACVLMLRYDYMLDRLYALGLLCYLP